MSTYIELTHDEMKARVIEDANEWYNGRTSRDNDLVYDEMLRMIKADEPDFDIYKYIKYDVADSEKSVHTIKFREFTKEADIADFTAEDFEELKKKYIVTPKFDGSSTVSYYQDGKLVRILSRGDDEIGIVNTKKLWNKVPHELNEDIVAMLAEAVVPIRFGGRAKANGLINSKELQSEVDEKLTLIPFDYQYKNGLGYPNTAIECSVEQIIRIRDTSEYEYMGEVYPCDGVVAYPREQSNFIEIHKVYFTEMADTILRKIDWELAWNSGLYHPVAEFDTVTLDNTYVSRASLYNYQNLLDCGYRVGSHLKVIKARMTIPKIESGEDLGHNEDGSVKLESEKCPYCGDKFSKVTDDILEIETITCKNEKCTHHNHGFNAFMVRCPHCGEYLSELGSDLICTNDNCTFWMFIFKFRIANLYNNGNEDELYEYLWQLESSDFQFVKELLPNDWYTKLINDMPSLMSVLGLPRVGNAKINKITTEKGDKVFNTLDESLEFISNFITWYQYAYLMKIKPILKHCVEMLN